MEAIAHNPPALKQPRERAQKRGFSLIEAAFVLGVVGLVIGGIWVAAAKVIENQRMNETLNGIISIKSSIQNLISARDAETLGDVYYLNSLVGEAIALPAGWEKRSGNYLKTSISNLIILTTKTNPETSFGFSFQGVKKAECIKIISRISALQAPLGSSTSRIGLIWIRVFDMDGGGVQKIGTSTFPITPEQAESGCVAANNQVQLLFGFTRIN